MTEFLDLLCRIRDRLDSGWCQMVLARDSSGVPCPPEAPQAERYCILGAFRAETKTLSEEERERLLPLFLTALGGGDDTDVVIYWNDSITRTKWQVIAAIDQAIAVAAKGVEELP